MNHIYDIAEWIVYNIEDLTEGFVESESPLSFSNYIKSRVATSLQLKYDPQQINTAFDDERIKTIISFYEEERDESEDTLH